jgi:hypothetical protein
MNCNQCGNDTNGLGDVCPACVVKEKIILFDTVEAAAKDAESQPPGIISIRHVVRYGDKFVIVGHINCEHCAYCSEELPLLAPNAFVTGPHEPKEMYPREYPRPGEQDPIVPGLHPPKIGPIP